MRLHLVYLASLFFDPLPLKTVVYPLDRQVCFRWARKKQKGMEGISLNKINGAIFCEAGKGEIEETLRKAADMMSDGQPLLARDLILRQGEIFWGKDPDAVLMLMHISSIVEGDSSPLTRGYCRRYLHMSFGKGIPFCQSSGVVQRDAPDPEFVIGSASILLWGGLKDDDEKIFLMNILKEERIWRWDCTSLVHAGAIAFELGEFSLAEELLLKYNSVESANEQRIPEYISSHVPVLLALCCYAMGKEKEGRMWLENIRIKGAGVYGNGRYRKDEEDERFEVQNNEQEADSAEGENISPSLLSILCSSGVVVQSSGGTDKVSGFAEEALKQLDAANRENGFFEKEKSSLAKTANPKYFPSIAVYPDGTFVKVILS